MKTNESAEMYLEAILLLKEQQPNVRAIDVVHYTGYSKPSVSRAMGLLRQNNLITVEETGYIHLTSEGHALATKVVERHRVLTEFLVKIGVSEIIKVCCFKLLGLGPCVMLQYITSSLMLPFCSFPCCL